MSLYDAVHDPAAGTLAGTFWEGLIAADVATVTARASVRIPALDSDLVFTDIRWQTRHAPLAGAPLTAISAAADLDALKAAVAAAFAVVLLPARGDRCLVVFDQDVDPWIVVWWPAGYA